MPIHIQQICALNSTPHYSISVQPRGVKEAICKAIEEAKVSVAMRVAATWIAFELYHDGYVVNPKPNKWSSPWINSGWMYVSTINSRWIFGGCWCCYCWYTLIGYKHHAVQLFSVINSFMWWHVYIFIIYLLFSVDEIYQILELGGENKYDLHSLNISCICCIREQLRIQKLNYMICP